MSKEESLSVDFKEALSERYLAYALSTIMSRSLPDIRDGLKPVHRRVLYAMHQLKLDPQSGFKKSARIVGDVMGKFHPHGDGAIYDTLVRLAQSFSVRYPLIDGQGNFGNIDGDNAAAMRYTEARLTSISEFLINGIDKDSIDFKTTYDNESKEPSVLPASFPNILANGSSGIAVGMATNIPPHNLHELMDALIHLLENDNATTSDIMKYIKGPDLPTGGVITDSIEEMEKSYESGKGPFNVRAKYHIEDIEKGQFQIVVTEIPYLVNKSKLIEKIAHLMEQKKLPLLGDLLDESDENLRIVLQPKSKNVDPKILMEMLFQSTDLQNRFTLNMNVIIDGIKPSVISLVGVLKNFLKFRTETILRQIAHRLDEINTRLNILSGYLIAYLNIDEIISIIRNEDNPKEELIKRFDLNQLQAEAILNMRLKSLRSLHEIDIRKEFELLTKEKDNLISIQNSRTKQKNFLKKEFENIKKIYGKDSVIGKRRTTFEKIEKIDINEVLVKEERENLTIIFSKKGWVKSMKGHDLNLESTIYKDGDSIREFFEITSDIPLLIIASNGRSYKLDSERIPTGRIFKAMASVLLELEAGVEIVSIIPYINNDDLFIVVSSENRGFLIESSNILPQTKSGRLILNLGDNDKLRFFKKISEKNIAVIGENRRLLIFPISELPVMSKGKGVIIQKYKDCNISDITSIDVEKGLHWKKGDRNYKEMELSNWIGKRASSGRLAPMGFPRTNLF